MEPTNDDLWERAEQGDRAAFASLLTHEGHAIRPHIASRIPRRWRSVLSDDDVLQAAYVDALRGMGRFLASGNGSLQAWLKRVAEFNLVDAVRMLEAEKRGGDWQRWEPLSPQESVFAFFSQLIADTLSPSKRVAREEALRLMEEAIRQLPETYQMVVRMCDLERCPMQTAALALHRSEGAVAMIRVRTHRELRRMLGNTAKYLSAG